MATNWNDDEVRMLINLRKTDNERFHRIGHVKRPFWKEVAGKINQRFRSNYSAQQCKQKFNDAMYNYIHSIPGGKSSRNGVMYYEEFKTEFWRKPETEYDRMHRANQAARTMLGLSSASSSFANYGSSGLVLIDPLLIVQENQGEEDKEGCFIDNQEEVVNQEVEEVDNQESRNQEVEEVDNQEVNNEGEESSSSSSSSSSNSS
ncbi:unnamed protein product [Rhizophagus irregularis]|nr:unnamed protein product [Rhizophagus irregularis]